MLSPILEKHVFVEGYWWQRKSYKDANLHLTNTSYLFVSSFTVHNSNLIDNHDKAFVIMFYVLGCWYCVRMKLVYLF